MRPLGAEIPKKTHRVHTEDVDLKNRRLNENHLSFAIHKYRLCSISPFSPVGSPMKASASSRAIFCILMPSSRFSPALSPRWLPVLRRWRGPPPPLPAHTRPFMGTNQLHTACRAGFTNVQKCKCVPEDLLKTHARTAA